MTAPPSKRLLEELIPLAEIGRESAKSVAYGDIHAIHTWFARRPLAACRAATFAALVDAPRTEAELEALQQLIQRGLLNTAPRQDDAAIHEMRDRIRQTFGGRAPKVLDPFGGGGSLPLEAARLGCEAHALDLNPVAVLTMLGTVDYPLRHAGTRFPLPETAADQLALDAAQRSGNLVEAVKAWSDWVLQQVQPKLEAFYPPEPDGGVVIAYFWAKTVRCTNPACGAEIPLVAHRWLSRRPGKPPVAYRLVPQPDRTLAVEILEGERATADAPDTGTMARGSARCLCCPQSLSPDEVKAQARAGQSGRYLMAVAFKRADATGTFFRAATHNDQQAFERARQALDQTATGHSDPFLPLAPDEPMPPARAYGIYPQLYGALTWGHMFNARQALTLSTLSATIGAAYSALQERGATAEQAQAVCLYLAFGLSRMAPRMSEASRWDSTRLTIQSATGGHRLPMLWDYAEANPLSGGSGSWEGTLGWSLASIERLLGAGEPAQVKWGDAASIPVPDNTYDAVLTDPPYYDSVPYGYLSDMQYVWLHRTLKDILPAHFPAPLTPKKAEIIQDRARHANDAAAKAFFEERLQAALAEARRVLKPDGIALVMYAHTATSAWETLVNALISAGFQVTASWPVNTETASRREWLGGAMLSATILLVCRKRAGERVGYVDEILPEMREQVRLALARFWAAGIGGADFFVSAIGPALSVFSRYREVRYSSGQPVSVANFLTLVRQAVVDFSLERALAGVDVGQVDRTTQFALLWRWTYGHQKVETGAARLLDKATGVELADLERSGLLGRANGANKMVLFGPHQRPELLERTLRRAQHGSAPLIDVIHCACMLWRDNRREELHQLLAEQGDITRQAAQALADLQPDGSDERRLILGFLGAWSVGLRAGSNSGKASQLKMDI